MNYARKEDTIETQHDEQRLMKCVMLERGVCQLEYYKLRSIFFNLSRGCGRASLMSWLASDPYCYKAKRAGKTAKEYCGYDRIDLINHFAAMPNLESLEKSDALVIENNRKEMEKWAKWRSCITTSMEHNSENHNDL